MSASQQNSDEAVKDQVRSTADRFPVTFFTGVGASSKKQELWSLNALAHHIANTTGPRKSALPWLKLATFGDKRTPERSLRHDDNVVTVTGIEVDYDGEQVPFEDAVECLTKQGVLALIYTSPSHTEDHQRWRILCPLSSAVPPSQRAKCGFRRKPPTYSNLMSPSVLT